MSDYDIDVLAWSERQSTLLRRMAAGERVNDQIDWENIAEEVEALGRSERRELHSRIATILLHLMKLEVSTATEPRAGWRDSIREQRRGLRRLVVESPSLRAELVAAVASEMSDARAEALASLADHGETPRVDVAGLDYTEEQVFGPWLPE